MSQPDPCQPMDLALAVRQAAQRLAAAGVPTPQVDAELLAAHVLGVSHGELAAMLIRGASIAASVAGEWEALIAARQERRPLQHLTGKAPFRHVELAVGPGVFIPRPETELIAGWAIDEANAIAAQRVSGDEPGHALVVDLCTGSGAIAIAVADESPSATVIAVEREADALAWTRRNIDAQRDAVRARLDLFAGDVTHDLSADAAPLAPFCGRVDVVVSNPPYIPDDAVPVDVEVARYDPAAALFGGGGDGLLVPRAVVALAATLLRPGGLFLMEHAEVQGASTRALLADSQWHEVCTRVDLAGRDRVLQARTR